MNRNVLETQQAELSKQVDELAKQNETLQQQNKVLENSIDATNQLARAIEDIPSTYDSWQRYGKTRT
jgi:uncharacterized protein YlxW (UPF0749 family)